MSSYCKKKRERRVGLRLQIVGFLERRRTGEKECPLLQKKMERERKNFPSSLKGLVGGCGPCRSMEKRCRNRDVASRGGRQLARKREKKHRYGGGGQKGRVGG